MEEPTIIEINETTIIEKLQRDGDLRANGIIEMECYEAEEGDDLGFYQKACDYLIARLAVVSLKKALQD